MKKSDLSKMLISYSQCQPFGAPDFKSEFVVDLWFKVLGHMDFVHVYDVLHMLVKEAKFPSLKTVEELVCSMHKDRYASEETIRSIQLMEAEEERTRIKRGLPPSHASAIPESVRLQRRNQENSATVQRNPTIQPGPIRLAIQSNSADEQRPVECPDK